MTSPASKSGVMHTYEEIAEGVEERRRVPWADIVSFERTLDRGLTVLDLGCGTGRNAVHYASTGHEVVALDFSRGTLHHAAHKFARLSMSKSTRLLQGDVCALPLKESTFDVCLYVAVLHHLPTREERLGSLAEVKRCLKPGGSALISVWSFDQRRFEKVLKEHRGRKEGFGNVLVPIRTRDGRNIKRFYHLFLEGELERLVRDAGLQVERCFKSHDNYFVVAVRPHRNR